MKDAQFAALLKDAQLKGSMPSVRITSMGRSTSEQASIMLTRAKRDPADFTRTYGRSVLPSLIMLIATRITQPLLNMSAVEWATAVVTAALSDGHKVSPHINNQAVDVSIPAAAERSVFEAFCARHGAIISREPNASTGPHWHVTLAP